MATMMMTMNPALCVENISKVENLNARCEEKSPLEMSSLSERSTCSTDRSSTLLREGSERWDFDDESSQSDTPSTLEKTLQQLQTIFESDKRAVDTADEESTSELSDEVSVVAEVIPSEVSTPKKQLSWGVIEMRLYPIILGDHPDAWLGPPITIDWTHTTVLRHEIDDYERKRNPRKMGSALHLSWLDRRRMLLRLGTQESDMQAAVESCSVIRLQREKTAAPWQVKLVRAEKAKDSLFRKFTKSIFRKRSKGADSNS